MIRDAVGDRMPSVPERPDATRRTTRIGDV
jgi:hypothetical protein